MSPYFINETKLQTMINELTTGPEVKSDTTLVELIKVTCDQLKKEYQDFKIYWENQLKQLVEDPVYVESSTWKIPDNTAKTCDYITPSQGNINIKSKRIKDLYSQINLNDDKQTFNGKVTFN